jgi:hypothetical protein
MHIPERLACPFNFGSSPTQTCKYHFVIFKVAVLHFSSENAAAAGTVTFNQIVVSGCIQEDLVLRFSAHHLTTVTSVPFDVFAGPNMPNITGQASDAVYRPRRPLAL